MVFRRLGRAVEIPANSGNSGESWAAVSHYSAVRTRRRYSGQFRGVLANRWPQPCRACDPSRLARHLLGRRCPAAFRAVDMRTAHPPFSMRASDLECGPRALRVATPDDPQQGKREHHGKERNEYDRKIPRHLCDCYSHDVDATARSVCGHPKNTARSRWSTTYPPRVLSRATRTTQSEQPGVVLVRPSDAVRGWNRGCGERAKGFLPTACPQSGPSHGEDAIEKGHRGAQTG